MPVGGGVDQARVLAEENSHVAGSLLGAGSQGTSNEDRCNLNEPARAVSCRSARHACLLHLSLCTLHCCKLVSCTCLLAYPVHKVSAWSACISRGFNKHILIQHTDVMALRRFYKRYYLFGFSSFIHGSLLFCGHGCLTEMGDAEKQTKKLEKTKTLPALVHYVQIVVRGRHNRTREHEVNPGERERNGTFATDQGCSSLFKCLSLDFGCGQERELV